MNEFTRGKYWATLYDALNNYTRSDDHQDAAVASALDVVEQAAKDARRQAFAEVRAELNRTDNTVNPYDRAMHATAYYGNVYDLVKENADDAA